MRTWIAAHKATLTVLAAVLVSVCATPSGSMVWAQETVTEAPAPTTTPAPTPIPAAEIPSKSGQTQTTLREISGDASAKASVTEIEESLDGMGRKLDTLESDTDEQLADGAPRSSLEELQKRWLRENTFLTSWLDKLQGRSEGLEKDLGKIRTTQNLWQLTYDSADEQEMPAALRNTVRATLMAADNAKTAVSTRRDEVLTLQTEVSKLKERISESLVPIRQAISEQSRSVLVPNQPPIWRVGWQPDGDESLAERIRQARQNDLQIIADYVKGQPNRVANQVFGFLVWLVAFWILGRRARQWAEEDESLQATARLLQRPVASSLLISTLMQEWFHPQAPNAWYDALSVLLLLALFRLLPAILPPNLRPGLLILVVLFLLERLVILVPQEVLLYRLAMLMLACATAAALTWLVRSVGDSRESRYPRWHRVAVDACKFGIGLMALAALADVIGSVDFAEVLVQGVLICIYFGVLLWTGTLVLRGAIAVFLRTRAAQRLNMVRSNTASIQHATRNAINFAALVLWISYALHGFGLRTEVTAAITRTFKAEVTLGEFTLRPLSIIPVLIAVWLTFKISRFVRFILANDVLPKVSLPRGVPATILKITHYVILTLGFFFVVSMLGIDLNKFTLIAGALGVGVGFGLQNIVNNFVSGLILLFERPIKEGDKIQVGSVSGQVKRIGMRASIVRTWQGAEVIVPNADLISKELVNWTLYDMRRRIDIPIGTAYGSDPEAVMNLLYDVATGHPDVLDDPTPSVPFMGFGDSSLDFELRAWTIEDIVRVKSELAVAMNRALAGAGIEIPFPQRDIHLRSTDEDSPPVDEDRLEKPKSPSTANAAVDTGRPRTTDPEGTSGAEMDLGGDDR